MKRSLSDLLPDVETPIVPRDESHDWNEFNIYVIFFVICYKWWK